MFSRKTFIAIAGMLVLAASFTQAHAQSGKSPLIMVDFVVMNDGYGLKERDIYDAKTLPIAHRYGVKRLASLNVVKNLTMKGFKVKRVDLWLLPSVNVLQAWANDAEYKTLLPFRNKVHDMRNLSLYFAAPAMPLKALGKGHFLLEFLRAGPGFDGNTFAAYEKKSAEISSPYGIRKVGALNISKKINGTGPNGQRLNILTLTTEQNFLSWVRSAEFKSLEPVRNRLFDRASYLLLVTQSR